MHTDHSITSLIAIRKSGLTPAQRDALFRTHSYQAVVERNVALLESIVKKLELTIDVPFIQWLRSHSRLNGALNVTSFLATRGRTPFFDLPHRLSRSGTHSRGYTYIIALDKGLTAAEKLTVLKKDLIDALRSVESSSSRLERFLLSDVVKNAVMTMLNALLSEEKLGLFRLDDDGYQRMRVELVDLASLAARFHCQFFLRDQTFTLPSDYEARTENALSYLETRSWRRYLRLQSAALSRPEATHPLVIFCSSLLMASQHGDVTAVIGLPSGSTELALVTAWQYDILYRRSPATLLLPISLHSAKDFSEGSSSDGKECALFLEMNAAKVQGGTVLICDDNSSTGRTLQEAYDSVGAVVGSGTIVCAVAEIDIVRSLLDHKNDAREFIANPVVYEDAVNVLPVSRHLRPKTDLKELMEHQELRRHHQRELNRTTDEIEQIYREVMLDVLRRDTVDMIRVTPEHSLVRDVRGTQLSNFYAVPINHNGVEYPTVEHAYQRQKFSATSMARAQADSVVRREIEDAMRARGYGASIGDLEGLFTDKRFNAGNIKIAADILRKHGYGRKRWAEDRVRAMIELLLCKFADARMLECLRNTGERIIIEGNDWGDTLWGFCNGQGLNLLGRTLMIIRQRRIP